ncbi:hypothetical protein F8388_003187 [Cannabis sativa]|uniref:AP-5 complex subunit zeta-1 ARM repeats domain-containing protein n=1 Tax=Cannabis sativa TaxID=3483 RepID=A0A7J6EEQ7_CANSA|nr:hypothetical protein F8388_003187 [Cannabis sativa]
MDERSRDWDFYLRSLSNSARDSNTASDPASDSSLVHSVKKLHELCKAENAEDLVVRVYPHINKLFQRSVASLSQSRTSNGLLLLAILQFYLDFGDVVLHDADPSLRTFLRTCLSREFADPVVAEAALDFLNTNKRKLLSTFPTLLPQFFPLLLKLIAWNGENLEKSFMRVFPGLISPGSFLPLFPSLVDLPIVALEKVERSSGSLVGNSIASIQKSTAPEMLLALMDEAYTGTTIGDGGGDSESEDSSTIDVADPVFLDLLKDENDGLAERQWNSPGMAAALQAAINTTQSDRLKHVLKIAPRLIEVYFAIALRDVNDSLICALISLLMSRNATIFPDKNFLSRFLEFMLSSFQRSPNFIALLKKPIMDRLAEAYDSPEKPSRTKGICIWILEPNHQEVITVEASMFCCYSNSKTCDVARSRISDARVSRRARDYLGLMNEPAISLSILGPSQPSNVHEQNPGTMKWSDGSTKMIAHIPFYILGSQEGPPAHDFSFSDITPRR